jgi:hypothetical protein
MTYILPGNFFLPQFTLRKHQILSLVLIRYCVHCLAAGHDEGCKQALETCLSHHVSQLKIMVGRIKECFYR